MVFAQGSSVFIKKLEALKIEPIVALQIWSTYTTGAKVYNADKKVYESVDNRINTQLRRSRVGIKGEFSTNLKFNFTAALDLVGRDLLAGTEGGANNGGAPKFQIWNAYLQWKLLNKSEALYVTSGYFPPQIGRESITSAMRSTSMEKSWSQNYLRRQLTGTGPGRVMGVNFGGLFVGQEQLIGFGYDLGLFNPAFQSFQGNSSGKRYAPLLVGRLVLHIGDPEHSTYRINHKVNYFSKRKGISIAFAGAHQRNTDLFSNNTALVSDFLFNWKNLNLDGEFALLQRSKLLNEQSGIAQKILATAHTAYFRMGYNIHLSNQWIIEPIVMIMQFNGGLTEAEQYYAEITKLNSGKDHTIDLGANLFLSPDLKLNLHYTLKSGDPGHAGAGTTINNYFYQAGIGPIQRGDWLGAGIVATL